MKDNPKEEWRYNVIDKREANTDNNKRQEETEKSEAKDKEDSKNEKPIKIDVIDTLKWMFEILRSQVYIKIGLIAHPQTNLIVQDFPQAKLGIDVLMSVFEKLSPYLKSEEQRTMRSIISDLQINYVEQLKKAGKT